MRRGKIAKSILAITLAVLVGATFSLPITTSEVSAAAKPKKVTYIKTASAGYNAIKVTWKQTKNAKTYKIYRATKKNGKYKCVKTVKKSKTTLRAWTNTKLTTGKRYYYKIRAYNGKKKSSYSSKKSAVPTLSRTTLKASAASSSSIKLSWTKISGAQGYQVYRATSKSGKYTKIKTTTARSLTNTGLSASKTYYYKVRSYRKVGKSYKYSSYSYLKSAKTLTKAVTTPTTPPSGSGSGGTTTPTTPPSGSGDTTTTPTIKGQTVVTAKDLVDTASKDVTVNAPAAAGADNQAEIKATSAKAADPASVAVPTGFAVSKSSSKNVQLTWNAVSGANGYEVYRSESAGSTGSLLYTAGQTKYCDTKVTEETTYYYKVRACRTENNITTKSSFTSAVSVKVPKDPGSREGVTVDESGITLTWDEPELTTAEKNKLIKEFLPKIYPDYSGDWNITNTGYKYRVTRSDKTTNVANNITVRTVTDNVGLVNGKRYTYTIEPFITFSAVSADNSISCNDYFNSNIKIKFEDISYEIDTSAFSNVPGTGAKLSPPRGFSAVGNYNNVVLSWEKAEDATGYRIYRNGALVKALTSGSDVSYTDSGLTPQTSYSYTIKTVKGSSLSTAASSLTIKTPKKPSFLPPAEINAVASYDKVMLTWIDNPIVEKYYVYRNNVKIEEITAGNTEYVDKTVSASTQYTYAMSSVAGGKESAKTTFTVKTPALPALMPPTSFKAVGNYDNVTLAWDINDKAEKYYVYRNNVKIGEVTATDIAYGTNKGYADLNVTQGTKYTYSVSSVAGGKESAKNSLQITVPKKVTGIYPVSTNVKLSYGNANIYLGQTWTSTIKSQLSAGASGTETVCRPGYMDWSKNENGKVVEQYVFNQYVYMFDTGDYDNFLAVYVANDQIVQWVTNRKDMGSENGVTLTRGATSIPEHGYPVMSNRLSTDTTVYYPGVKRGGVFIGGFRIERSVAADTFPWDSEVEKRIGFHFINAYRVAAGSKPLKYHDQLDGKNYTYTGEVKYRGYDEAGKKATITENVVNVRYGAQALAETASASKMVDHETHMMKAGSLAGQWAHRNDMIVEKAANDSIAAIGENIGGGGNGESCIAVYEDSALHLAAMLSEDMQYVGIGFGSRAYTVHAEKYGYDWVN